MTSSFACGLLDALCCGDGCRVTSSGVSPSGMGLDVAARHRPCSGAMETLGMRPQWASIPRRRSGARLRATFELCGGLAATSWEAPCQCGAWVSLRKGRGTQLGNGVIPARQLGGLRLQSQMAHGRPRGAGHGDQRSPFKVPEDEGMRQHPLDVVPYPPPPAETVLGLEPVVAAPWSRK